MQLNKQQLRRLCILFFTLAAGLALSISKLQAQEIYTVEQIGTLLPDLRIRFGPTQWFALFEIPVLCMTIFFSFLTADALKGGLLGRGMNLVAWGFLVMAVGHLHMQVEHLFHYNLFTGLFGKPGGSIAWFTALTITWGLLGVGFYSIYKASKVG
jgi:hypothetical protein